MNHVDAYAEPVHGGYHAMVRTAGDGQPKPILGPGGKPQLFGTELEAFKEATHHMLRYVNGNYVRDGEIAGETAATAHAAFKVVKQKGKTRQISVTYKRGRGNGT